MTPERWRRVDELFHAALERDGAERADFLAEACAGDDALRREVERLVAAHEQDGSFIDSPAYADTQLLVDRQAVLNAGQRLGPYKVIGHIGSGGMGEVYSAEDTRLGRKVALKLLPAAFTGDEDRLRRFRQEARSTSALNHPNILTIHEIGSEDGTHFMATEYVEGETLRQRMAGARMKLGEALDLAIQVAGALAAAHEAGIVHRDVKPENIMVRRDGYAKVLDFGIAKLIERRAAGTEATTALNTEPGVVAGTAQYMSPEQARGQEVDVRTDVWSLGVVIYEMVAGRAPFEGETPSDILVSLLDKEPAPLSRYSPGVPAELQRIVRKGLRKEREDRYQAMGELLVDLKDLKRALERSAITHLQYRIAGVAVSAVLMIAALVVWTFVRRAQAEAERKAAVAEMEHLVDVGRFVDAWRVGGAALQRWPGDPQLEHPMRVTTQPVTITTDPPGAEVAFKAYEDVTGEWLPLGTTPLDGVRAPIGQLRWRITKAGFEPLEARLDVGAPAAAAGRPDVKAPPDRKSTRL